MEKTGKKQTRNGFRKIIFSQTLLEKSHSHKISYIAITTALMVVVNMLEVKLGGVQFSLTIFVSCLAGIFLGAIAGFGACFIGDLVGFFIHPMGEYSPWIGIATGLMAFFIGAILLLPYAKKIYPVYLALGCVLIFLFCTCGITTWYLDKVWFQVGFWACLKLRIFVQGQIWNSLFNYALLFIVTPVLAKIKPLHLHIG